MNKNYAYSPATGELIQTDVIAAWMNVTKEAPPEFDAATSGCFWRGDQWEIVPATPAIAPAPHSITMRQARLVLLEAGLYDAVNQAVSGGQMGQAAQIEWEYAATVERDNPLFSHLAGALGLTDDQVDDLFRKGAAL